VAHVRRGHNRGRGENRGRLGSRSRIQGEAARDRHRAERKENLGGEVTARTGLRGDWLAKLGPESRPSPAKTRERKRLAHRAAGILWGG